MDILVSFDLVVVDNLNGDIDIFVAIGKGDRRVIRFSVHSGGGEIILAHCCRIIFGIENISNGQLSTINIPSQSNKTIFHPLGSILYRVNPDLWFNVVIVDTDGCCIACGIDIIDGINSTYCRIALNKRY